MTHEAGQIDEQELGALLAEGFDLAAVVDRSGEVAYLNRAGRRTLGLPLDGALHDRTLTDLVAAGDHPLLDARLPEVAAGHAWTGVMAVLVRDVGPLPTRTTLIPLPTGRIGWVARDISTERAVYERLHKKIFEDELTGLPHRSIFLDRLDLALRRTGTDAAPLALLFLSLDRFKEKNDRFGREVGDDLLREVSRRLVAAAGEHTVSRWGGDEFVVLLEAGGEQVATAVASAVLATLDEPIAAGPVDAYLTASIGIAAAAPGDGATEELLRHADAASQMAKRRGGSTVHVFDEAMRARALRRAEVEDALRGAVTRRELVLHYQPEISLRTNEIVAVEALLRWQHPEWGLVAPGEFVPVAETSNLILELGAWAMEEAMGQVARWRDQLGDRAPYVAVNISGRQFAQDDFVELVATSLDSTGAEPADVCLEITESVLMDDLDVATATLQRLKVLGVQLAVDDFGTGYSSLSYLRRFPVDVLKVDKSFVNGLGHDPEDSAIVQAVVHIGRALGLTTVAEGVETAHHLIELRELDCDVAQGFHFARPRPAEVVTRMLEAGPAWPRVEV